MGGDRWREEPLREAHHVTYLKPASAHKFDEYISWKVGLASSAQKTVDDEYIELMDRVEAKLSAGGEGEGEEGPDAGGVDEMLREMAALESRISKELLEKCRPR